MTFKETMAAIFSSSEGAYYKWKKENRPIIALLETYFTKDDLEEFLKFGRIEKMDALKSFQAETYSVCNNFFFEPGSRVPINREFAEFFFPVYDWYQKVEITRMWRENPEAEKQWREKNLKQESISIQESSSVKYFIKRNFIEFILKLDDSFIINYERYTGQNIEDNFKKNILKNKVNPILTSSKLTDFELYLLVISYKQFFNEKYNQ